MFLPFQVVPTKNMLSDPCDPKTEARNFQLDNICLPSEKAISCIRGTGVRGWERLAVFLSFPSKVTVAKESLLPILVPVRMSGKLLHFI